MPAGYDEREAERRAEDRAYSRDSSGRNPYGRMGDSYRQPSEYREMNDAERIFQHLPFGIGESIQADQARRDQLLRDAKQEAYVNDLIDLMPSIENLVPEYSLEATRDEYGNLLMGSSELESMGPNRAHRALEALGGIIDQGGYTEADRAASRQAAMAQGQQLRSNTDAIIQQMSAQGMGGSGAELAARLSAAQQAAMGNAMSDAMVQQAAMQRALQAMQGYGALGSTMYGQDMSRRGQIDAYNQANMDWRRGRETRNTQIANQQQDARVAAHQTAHQNRERAAALATQQYNNQGQTAQQQYQNQRDAKRSQDAAFGTIYTTAAGG